MFSGALVALDSCGDRGVGCTHESRPTAARRGSAIVEVAEARSALRVEIPRDATHSVRASGEAESTGGALSVFAVDDGLGIHLISFVASASEQSVGIEVELEQSVDRRGQ